MEQAGDGGGRQSKGTDGAVMIFMELASRLGTPIALTNAMNITKTNTS
jgi:hypothetical protein